MAVAREEDVVADAVVVERLQRAVLVRQVPVPGVTVVRVRRAAEPGRDVDPAEDDLRADEAPGRAAGGGGGELVVEPALPSAQNP